jgi:glutamine amidotransferase
VASEPIDENPVWQLLAPGELVHVSEQLDIERHVIIDHPPRYWLTL